MALTYSIVKKGVFGNMRANIVDINLDGSYAAGGYALTPASMGIEGQVHMVLPVNASLDGVLAVYDTTNSKLALYKGASTVTVTSGNAEFTQLATNDTIIDANSKVRVLVLGDAPSG